MQTIAIVYLAYMFVTLYFFFFFLILFLRNRKEMFDYPKADRNYSLSVVTPAYNEEDSIEGTIRAVLDSDYHVLEMIVVDDCSKDGTGEIVKRLMKRYSNLRLISHKNNTGKAGSLNDGIRVAKGELIAIIDSDSYPRKDAIGKMIGFFNDKKVGAVTSSILVRHQDHFVEKMQAMEYSTIAWTRKLLGYIEGIWATPGPLSIYRAKLLKSVRFDVHNLTEDIEVTWHIISKGYRVEMCLPARVYSIAPKRIMHLIKQRIRWDIGGIQCTNKYKSLFLRKGMLGFFVVPFFTLSMFLGLLGTSVFVYLGLRRIIMTYFFAQYSFGAGTSLLSFEEMYITPTVLNFFGIFLFVIGILFAALGLTMMKEIKLRGFRNIFNLLFYSLIYLAIYPLILIFAIVKMGLYRIKGKKIGWGTK